MDDLEGRSPVLKMRNLRLREDLGLSECRLMFEMCIFLFSVQPNPCGCLKMPSDCEFGTVGSQRGGGDRYSFPFLLGTYLLVGRSGRGEAERHHLLCCSSITTTLGVNKFPHYSDFYGLSLR